MKIDPAQVIEALPGLIWTALPDGTVIFLNQQWCEYAGVAEDEVSSHGWQTCIHGDDLPEFLERWRNILAAREQGEIEARLRRFDDTYRWFLFRVRPLIDASERIAGWCGLAADIDHRRREEEALRERERELRQIFDYVPGMIAVADSQGQHEYANKRCCDYTNRTVEGGRGLGFLEDIHPDERDLVKTEWLRCVALGQSMDIEHRLKRFDGVYRWFHVLVEPLVDDRGQIIRWYALLTDIDDQKNTESALGTVRSELTHISRVASLGVLTASIAHEVNQPLSGIITNAGTCLRMLAADPADIEGARETAQRTIRDGHRAVEVISRLRALFGKNEPTAELVDLNEAARDVISLSMSELQRSRVIVTREFASDLPPVLGDRVQLQQVILNLLLNASDAMDGVDDRPRQLVVRTERDEEDRVRLAVEDAGMGLDSQTTDKVFDAFYTTKRGGMGIGLSISRSIIEKHRGRLWAAPNDGPGTTFFFSLPGLAEPKAEVGEGTVGWSADASARHALGTS